MKSLFFAIVSCLSASSDSFFLQAVNYPSSINFNKSGQEQLQSFDYSEKINSEKTFFEITDKDFCPFIVALL